MEHAENPLRRWRRESRLSQVAMANLINARTGAAVTGSQINHWEHGRHWPRPSSQLVLDTASRGKCSVKDWREYAEARKGEAA